jgi:hypothetical protein
MHVLIIESRLEFQNKFLDVLSWFSAIRLVLLANERSELAKPAQGIDAVLIGTIDGMTCEEAVRDARRNYPNARIVAACDAESGTPFEQHLKKAGADAVIDTRFSVWKTGLILRELLWPSNGRDLTIQSA